MSHEFESGMFVGQGAWHGLGTVLQGAPSTSEAIIAAGLDWEVLSRPVYFGSEPVPGQLEHRGAQGYQALVRSTDQKLLSIVSQDYTPLQNKDAFRFFDIFLADRDATLETAGSLKGGRYIWVLAKIGSDQDVSNGDPVRPYLLLINGHTGDISVLTLFSPTRVVCWNTMSAARAEGEARAVKIRHHSKVAETLTAVRDTIDLSRRTFTLSVEEYRAMRSRGLDTFGLKKYIRSVLQPEPVKVPVKDQDAAPEAPKDPRAMDFIVDAFESSPGAREAGATVWGAYNAVTYWLDHKRGRSPESRLESTWLGEGKRIRDRAHAAALALV